MREIKQQTVQLQNDIVTLQRKISDLECRSRRYNLVFEGIAEREGESWKDCEEILTKTLMEKLQFQTGVELDLKEFIELARDKMTSQGQSLQHFTLLNKGNGCGQRGSI